MSYLVAQSDWDKALSDWNQANAQYETANKELEKAKMAVEKAKQFANSVDADLTDLQRLLLEEPLGEYVSEEFAQERIAALKILGEKKLQTLEQCIEATKRLQKANEEKELVHAKLKMKFEQFKQVHEQCTKVHDLFCKKNKN